MDAWKIKNNTVLILCRVFGFVNGAERLLIGQMNKCNEKAQKTLFSVGE